MLTINFSKKQTLAKKTLQDPAVDALLVGGAKGGGKTQFICYWAFLQCCELITKYKLSAQQHPIQVGWMGRLHSVDFSDTTLETWKRIIPSDYYTLRPGDQEIIIRNAVKISYGGFAEEQARSKFNSMELIFIIVDQAEEVSKDSFGLARASLRLKIKGQTPSYKILLSCNPADCWLKDDFIDNQQKGFEFIQFLPSDNPFLAEGYINTLKESFKHRPEMLQAYLYGSWEGLADADLVIKPSWVRESVNKIRMETIQKGLISCDPARFGDDETVINYIQNNTLRDTLVYGKKSTMETAGQCIIMKERYNANLIVVDETGIGSGVVDRLKELNQPVIGINFASKSDDEDIKKKYKNIRAEMYDTVGQMFYLGQVSIPDDTKLKSQLSHIKYKPIHSTGTIQIESKQDIKKRLSGDSPDRADALIMGLWASKFIEDNQYDYQRVDPDLLDRIANSKTYGDQSPIYQEVVERLTQDKLNRSDYDV